MRLLADPGCPRDRHQPPGANADSSHALLVHCDVIEIAEAVLQALEGDKEMLPPLRRPLAREQTGEEFRCVAQLRRNF